MGRAPGCCRPFTWRQSILTGRRTASARPNICSASCRSSRERCRHQGGQAATSGRQSAEVRPIVEADTSSASSPQSIAFGSETSVQASTLREPSPAWAARFATGIAFVDEEASKMEAGDGQDEHRRHGT